MKPILPDAALHQNIAVLGKNGSGKTTAAKAAIAEPLLAAGSHVVIVDPTGAWWGLRSSRDGKSPGFEVLVLGGDHGDLPLPANGGAAIARLVTEQGVNLVADTTQLTVGERTRWFTDFAGALYRANRAPLHLILDEAHNFAPQGRVPDPSAGLMLHAASTLASQGRSRGIRLTMITQRPQKLHKDSLTTAETLIAMRVIAPQDRSAVKDWIDGCAGDDGDEVVDSLANLARGEGWIWYPEGGVLQRLKFPLPTTFDSSATPMGAPIETPKGAAQLDLSEIRKALADAVAEAEASDPKALRARIKDLEGELQARDTLPQEVGAAFLEEAERRGYQRGRDEAAQAFSTLGNAVGECVAALRRDIQASIDARLAGLVCMPNDIQMPDDRTPDIPAIAPVIVRKTPVKSGVNPGRPGTSGLSKAERLILTALAQYPAGRTKTQVALLIGYSSTGGGFNNAVSALRTAGRLEGGPDALRITRAGLAALGSFERLPTGRALLAHWLGKLSKAERKILEALAEVQPRTLSKVQVANRAGYEPEGGGFNNAVSRLRTLELIIGRGELRASPNLFE